MWIDSLDFWVTLSECDVRISVLAANARILALLRKGWGYGLVGTARCNCDLEAAHPVCMVSTFS